MAIQIAFIDIETVPDCIVPVQEENGGPFVGQMFLTPEGHLFAKKHKQDLEKSEDYTNDACKLWNQRAALYAEFGKIVCVSIGLLKDDKLRITSIASKNEKTILEKTTEYLSKVSTWKLVAHNGLDFDFPFLRRRYLIHRLPVPAQLETYGRKPWETNLEDTMEIWSGTQWKYKVSLELLAHCFGIPSPKTEMDGSKVAEVFYGMLEVKSDELPFDKENAALKAIGDYCALDVITLAKIYCAMRVLPEITDDKIERV